MAVYLKEFETQAAYEAAQSGLILPNVSLTVDNNTVHYHPYVDPCTQYDYVEIGGVKWATKNIGACNITDIGLYFQWGDTSGYTASQVGSGEGQKYFSCADYKFGDCSSAANLTKYNNTDGKTALDTSDDAVNAAWGGNWRMPTKDEFIALGNAVNSEAVANYQGSGVSGRLMTDKTDSSKVLFFPNGGRCDDGQIRYSGSDGCYWSRNRATYYSGLFAYCYFSSGSNSVNWSTDYKRSLGYLIRGVLDE